MAAIALERIMDTVRLVVDCEDDAEATGVYNLLASQLLDGNTIRLVITRPDKGDNS